MHVTKSGNRIDWLLTSEVDVPNFELRYSGLPPSGLMVKGREIVKGPDRKTPCRK